MEGKGRGSVIDELVKKIRESKGLAGIEIAEVLKPNGYAEKVVKETDLTRVQLRKIFAEFKLMDSYFKSNPEKCRYHLYKLYPIVQYQTNRKLIPENFKKLIFAILDTLDSNFSEENFKRTMDFMEALVAYTPKD